MNFIKCDIFGLHKKQPKPATGDFIVAAPFLADGIFNRSVIYLAEYSETSSMGIIMNHPTEFHLNDVIHNIHVDNIPLFYGGPVSNDHLFFIHTLGNIIPESTQIKNGIFINGKLDIIKEYINSGETVNGKIRFFIGCSGWNRKQLENEINTFSWAVLKIENKKFSKYLTGEGNKYWEKRVLELGAEYKSWLLCPNYPFLN